MNNVIKTKLENLHKYRFPVKLFPVLHNCGKSFNFDKCYTKISEEIEINSHDKNFFFTGLKPLIVYLRSKEKLNLKEGLKYIESYFSILVRGNNFSYSQMFYENGIKDLNNFSHRLLKDINNFSHRLLKDGKVKINLNVHHGYNYNKKKKRTTNETKKII